MNWQFVFQFLGTDVFLQAFIWGLFALGVFIAYRILDVADLSVESVFPFAAIMSILLINSSLDPLLSIIVAVCLAMLCGLLNASLHIFLKIPSLLSGIIVMIALYSINVVLCRGSISIGEDKMTIITYLNHIFNNSMATKIVTAGLFLLGTMVLLYWFFGTELGLSLRAVGKNPSMSRAQGINTASRYILGMVLATGIIGLSGALYGQITTSVNTEDGRGSIVIGLAIIFLGEVIFGKRSFKISLLSILVGGLLYWLIMDIITIIPGFNSNYTLLVQALFITVVVSLPLLQKYLKNRFDSRRHNSEVSNND